MLKYDAKTNTVTGNDGVTYTLAETPRIAIMGELGERFFRANADGPNGASITVYWEILDNFDWGLLSEVCEYWPKGCNDFAFPVNCPAPDRPAYIRHNRFVYMGLGTKGHGRYEDRETGEVYELTRNAYITDNGVDDMYFIASGVRVSDSEKIDMRWDVEFWDCGADWANMADWDHPDSVRDDYCNIVRSYYDYPTSVNG